MEPTPPSRTPAGAPARPGSVAAPGRRVGGGPGGVGTIARAVGRRCSRPGCGVPAAATLVFSYAQRTATLHGLLEDADPQAYDLCEPHAVRTQPPRRWELADERPARPSEAPLDLDDEDGTIALLARALRGGPAAGDEAVADGPDAVADGPDDAVVAGADEHEADTGGPGVDVTGALAAPDGDEHEDPLRAALEEVQRVVPSDPSDDPAPPPTPLRRRRVVIVDVDDPDAEPTLW